MSDSPYLSRIEWKPCAESVTLEISDPIEGLPPGPESITIRRDDQYRLVADLGGTTSAEPYGDYHQTLRETVPGTIRADGVDVVARHLTGGARVRLSVGGSSNVSPFDKERFTWTATRHAYRLRQDHSNPSPPAWHTDWFLNGPRHLVLDRATEHSARTRYVRDRGDRKLDLTELAGENGQLDHIVVAAGDLRHIDRATLGLVRTTSINWPAACAVRPRRCRSGRSARRRRGRSRGDRFIAPRPDASTRSTPRKAS